MPAAFTKAPNSLGLGLLMPARPWRPGVAHSGAGPVTVNSRPTPDFWEASASRS